MKRRSRVRRVLKWVGVVLCVLLAGLWGAGTVVHVGITPSGDVLLVLTNGGFVVDHYPGANRRLGLWTSEPDVRAHWAPELMTGARTPTMPLAWWSAFIPFWLLLALIAPASVLFWHLDRRSP